MMKYLVIQTNIGIIQIIDHDDLESYKQILRTIPKVNIEKCFIKDEGILSSQFPIYKLTNGLVELINFQQIDEELLN